MQEIAPANQGIVEINQKIEELAAEELRRPQVDCPVTHFFTPGLYMRQIFMPAGTFIIGHEHKTEHFNIVLTGKARVLIGEEIEEITAPCIFISGAGIRKCLLVEEDMTWLTTHVTTETDPEKLMELLVVKSEARIQYDEELKKLCKPSAT